MEYYNFYDKGQRGRTASLPPAPPDYTKDPEANERFLQYLYNRDWADGMSFERFKGLFLKWEKIRTGKHFYEWVKPEMYADDLRPEIKDSGNSKIKCLE